MPDLSLVLGLSALWVLTTLGGLGNTVGYHRLLTHRSFVAPQWLRNMLILLGSSTGGSPVFWVALHRLHHLRSDAEGDPHSPIHGRWWAHCGWLIGVKHPVVCALFAVSGFGQQAAIVWHDIRRLAGRNPPTWRAMAKDLMKEPLLRVLDAPMVMPALFALQLTVAWAIAGPWGWVWLWALHVWLTNTSWAVNSICHLPTMGTQPFDTGEGSRDVPWMALVTLGESYHNGHHRYPRSARHGLDGGLDLSWWIISTLEARGVVTKVWLPKKYRPKAPTR